MRIRNFGVCIILLMLSSLSSKAQCGGVVYRLSYDSTVTGTGSQYPPYNFTFPQFDGGLGTLMSVQVASVVTVTYRYTIENQDNTGMKLSRVRITRSDVVSGPGLNEPFDTTILSSQNNHTLNSTDGVTGSGPDFFNQSTRILLNQDTVLRRLYTNTIDFIGTGSVQYDYISDAGYLITGHSFVTVGFQAEDQITFSITYTYCDNAILASNITSFTATRQSDEVVLRWNTSNERTGRIYEVLKSTDGKNFKSIRKMGSKPDDDFSGRYEYPDPVGPQDMGTIFFKIKQYDADGTISYSSVRSVDLGNKANARNIRLLPNPSAGGDFTLLFDNKERSDWKVEVYTMTGQVIARKQFGNCLSASMKNSAQLAKGVYVVRATNLRTLRSFTERLAVE